MNRKAPPALLRATVWVPPVARLKYMAPSRNTPTETPIKTIFNAMLVLKLKRFRMSLMRFLSSNTD